jgi:hypothetical protein
MKIDPNDCISILCGMAARGQAALKARVEADRERYIEESTDSTYGFTTPNPASEFSLELDNVIEHDCERLMEALVFDDNVIDPKLVKVCKSTRLVKRQFKVNIHSRHDLEAIGQAAAMLHECEYLGEDGGWRVVQHGEKRYRVAITKDGLPTTQERVRLEWRNIQPFTVKQYGQRVIVIGRPGEYSDALVAAGGRWNASNRSYTFHTGLNATAKSIVYRMSVYHYVAKMLTGCRVVAQRGSFEESYCDYVIQEAFRKQEQKRQREEWLEWVKSLDDQDRVDHLSRLTSDLAASV